MKIEDPHWQDWEVYIEDENQTQLPEYKHERWPARDGNPAYTSLYLECKDNQKFIIVVRRPESLTRTDISLDGALAVSGASLRSEGALNRISSIPDRSREGYRRALTFAPLVRLDSVAKVSPEYVKRLGTIDVKVDHGDFTPIAERPLLGLDFKEKIVHEAVRKARLTSYVGGGELVAMAPVPHNHFTSRGSPDYKIIFYYATRPALELLEVIPVEAQQGVKRYAPSQNDANGKDAHDEDTNDHDIVPLAGPSKRRKVEVVDLCSDSDSDSDDHGEDEDDDTVATIERHLLELSNELKALRKKRKGPKRPDPVKVKQERNDDPSSHARGPWKRR